MPVIFKTDDFVVEAHDEPHHSRENGGHIVIMPKARYAHRYDMRPELAAKMTNLSQVVGEAFTNAMRAKGVNIVRINYQDNGNWAYKDPAHPPHLHLHLYARTANEAHPKRDPRFQTFPDALVFPDRATGFYEDFIPLSAADCRDILAEFRLLLASDKYNSLQNMFGRIIT